MARTLKVSSGKGSLSGARILITAGPTHEYLDDVRYIGNPSTGRMGLEMARAAQRMGASVTVVCGPSSLQPPVGVKFVPVVSAEDMLEAVSERFGECDMFIATAAVSDYRPKERLKGKLKKGKKVISLKLVRNPDVLLRMGKRREEQQRIIGFSLETANSIENARGKLERKNCDLMVVTTPAHFGDAREAVRVISKQGFVAEIPPSTKAELAEYVCQIAADLRSGIKLPIIKEFPTATPGPSAPSPLNYTTQIIDKAAFKKAMKESGAHEDS
ncbi:MAG: phosphopantothenoylcysteine decarboxylase [Planctomycetes bacterium]|nr:phosphopantothenoylcysteine decarboxylase [Planctomycetota bacterium]